MGNSGELETPTLGSCGPVCNNLQMCGRYRLSPRKQLVRGILRQRLCSIKGVGRSGLIPSRARTPILRRSMVFDQ